MLPNGVFIPIWQRALYDIKSAMRQHLSKKTLQSKSSESIGQLVVEKKKTPKKFKLLFAKKFI